MARSLAKALWRGLKNNGLPALLSLAVHIVVAVLVLAKWQADKPVEPMLPKHVQASLVTLKTTTVEKKPVEKPVVKKAVEKPKPVPKAKPKPVEKKVEVKVPPKVVPEKKPEPKKVIEPKKPEPPKPKQPEINLEDDLFGALEEENIFQQAKNDAELAASYYDKIREAIEYQWSRPPSARRDMEVELAINLVPTGDVVSVSVIRSSGNDAFDRSALQAVEKVGRFPELMDVPSRVFEDYFRQFKLRFRPEDLRK